MTLRVCNKVNDREGLAEDGVAFIVAKMTEGKMTKEMISDKRGRRTANDEKRIQKAKSEKRKANEEPGAKMHSKSKPNVSASTVRS